MKWNRTDLDALPVYEKLVKLARKPFDLNAPGALSPDRISKYKTSAAGFDLLYSTQRVDDAAINGLQQLADQSGAVDQFLAMKHGAVLDRIEGYESENRQVLHTACRDIFSDSPCNGEATQQAKQQLENLKVFLAQLDTGEVTNAEGKTFTGYVNKGSILFRMWILMMQQQSCRILIFPGPWWGLCQKAAQPWKRLPTRRWPGLPTAGKA
jgi:glucose-6-phosphate isomerase